MKVLRIDDVPLLYDQISSLGLQELVDGVVQAHGNWSGLSMGHLLSIWLCYLLSESDHRLSAVEEWASEHELFLCALSGQPELTCKDFTDDRLEIVLDHLSKASCWQQINQALTGKSLEVYDLDDCKTIRLDAAPMQGHQRVAASNLFEHGYSKHHNPNLGMLKVMLASVDNAVNSFGYPLAHLIVGGASADDPLYRPIIKECETIFASDRDPCRKLYVGDSKMSSMADRSYIYQSNNDYLVPLSKIQLATKERIAAIEARDSQDYQQVYQTNKAGELEVIAAGFEQHVRLTHQDEDGKVIDWQERRLYVLSTAYATSQHKALERKLTQASVELEDVLERKQGRKYPDTKEELQAQIEAILSKYHLKGLLEVDIQEQTDSKTIRAYGQRPARIKSWTTFQLVVRRNETAIEKRKKMQGWQVYATTVSVQKLAFEKVIWKYRHQNRIESRFHDLRNKVVPLVPIFLSKDNRIESLIHVLMIGLKVCCLMEFKVAQQLHEQQQELDHIFEGNPKRATSQPTAKRLLKQFKGISMVIIQLTEDGKTHIELTELTKTQLRIIELIGAKPNIYSKLIDKIKFLITDLKISEI